MHERECMRKILALEFGQDGLRDKLIFSIFPFFVKESADQNNLNRRGELIEYCFFRDILRHSFYNARSHDSKRGNDCFEVMNLNSIRVKVQRLLAFSKLLRETETLLRPVDLTLTKELLPINFNTVRLIMIGFK